MRTTALFVTVVVVLFAGLASTASASYTPLPSAGKLILPNPFGGRKGKSLLLYKPLPFGGRRSLDLRK
jgi:hypothetical protein